MVPSCRHGTPLESRCVYCEPITDRERDGWKMSDRLRKARIAAGKPVPKD